MVADLRFGLWGWVEDRFEDVADAFVPLKAAEAAVNLAGQGVNNVLDIPSVFVDTLTGGNEAQPAADPQQLEYDCPQDSMTCTASLFLKNKSLGISIWEEDLQPTYFKHGLLETTPPHMYYAVRVQRDYHTDPNIRTQWVYFKWNKSPTGGDGSIVFYRTVIASLQFIPLIESMTGSRRAHMTDHQTFFNEVLNVQDGKIVFDGISYTAAVTPEYRSLLRSKEDKVYVAFNTMNLSDAMKYFTWVPDAEFGYDGTLIEYEATSMSQTEDGTEIFTLNNPRQSASSIKIKGRVMSVRKANENSNMYWSMQKIGRAIIQQAPEPTPAQPNNLFKELSHTYFNTKWNTNQKYGLFGPINPEFSGVGTVTLSLFRVSANLGSELEDYAESDLVSFYYQSSGGSAEQSLIKVESAGGTYVVVPIVDIGNYKDISGCFHYEAKRLSVSLRPSEHWSYSVEGERTYSQDTQASTMHNCWMNDNGTYNVNPTAARGNVEIWKPAGQPCEPKAYEWSHTAWSTCSTTCGGGSQSRTATCYEHDPPGTPLKQVVNTNCTEDKEVIRDCGMEPCTDMCNSDIITEKGLWYIHRWTEKYEKEYLTVIDGALVVSLNKPRHAWSVRKRRKDGQEVQVQLHTAAFTEYALHIENDDQLKISKDPRAIYIHQQARMQYRFYEHTNDEYCEPLPASAEQSTTSGDMIGLEWTFETSDPGSNSIFHALSKLIPLSDDVLFYTLLVIFALFLCIVCLAIMIYSYKYFFVNQNISSDNTKSFGCSAQCGPTYGGLN